MWKVKGSRSKGRDRPKIHERNQIKLYLEKRTEKRTEKVTKKSRLELQSRRL